MLKNIFLFTILIIALTGCAKKEAAVTTGASQDILNQSVQTQTELTLMGDEGGKAASGQAQPAVLATVVPPVAPTPDISSEEPTPEGIQQALKNANLYSGKIDGEIGPKTIRAIKNFQEQNGLTADGKVGPKTWAKMQAYLQQAPEAAASEMQD